ncbi:MAG: NAD(P)H-hydrate dehydratase [Pseudomonadota bacterium]|nr:NAD(P)H-hydrate dehydratase [Pseudomonadota bacterium]
MSHLPYTLYRAAEVRELDRIAIEAHGIPGIELMNRAGAALFDQLCRRWPDARKILVVCGAGNNGGDGYVVARLARAKGFAVTLVALRDPAMLIGDAKIAWGAAQAAGLSSVTFTPELLNNTDVVVDAIFGTGLDREVSGEWAAAINAINASGVPVLAVDIPSGLHADSGRVLGTAITAQATLSFIGLKCGMFTGEARDCCGEILFDDLGLPAAVYEQQPVSLQRIDWLRLKPLLPPRRRTAHKGDFGHLLIIAGNHGMAGAARLAAEAALRVGSGLVTVATRAEHVAAMAAARPEVMWRAVETAADLRPLLQRATVVAIGPGLGQDDWSQQLFNGAVESGLPLVVDADGLNLLARQPFKNEGWILTPHPGEAGRLLQCSAAEINQDRFHAAGVLTQQYGGVVVLKGAGTLVADATGEIAVCSGGNPGMASAGMGDTLTGVIGGLLAQGLSLSQAAQCGVALHAAAADKAALAGERGLIATDLISTLRALIN